MGNDPTSAHTKAQLKDWLEKSVENARNPDPREKLKKMRQERAKKEQKKYGLD